MAYTEKVSLNGTALSFLLYECVNSSSSQEGFLIGNVTTEITNHISDSQNDSARLDTQIFIRTVLPVPSVALFYFPTDVTANLGEKLTGYKKAPKVSPHSIFNKIVSESNVQNNNTNDAILHIQEAVDIKMISEAKLAAKNESAIRELEAEIKHMTGILSDKHMVDLQAAYNKLMEEKLINREVEMAEACVNVLKSPPSVDIMSIPNIFLNSNNLSDSENSVQLIENESNERSSSPIAVASTSTKPSLNYAAACKKSSDVKPSTSKTDEYEDLICFDVEDKHVAKPLFISDNIKCLDDSSPEF
ncbi:hypothetical protein RR46_01559 [Papilio xuthus]|uniref:Uncharacterized protein n=1 Tax=Papilio xuthus TaxID=66420 RepID=A0A0N1I3M4_PAPXU|nr:hypothetical protein RR46_01559 [Papilio xuthus]